MHITKRFKNSIDISGEMHICRTENGVRLIRPEQENQGTIHPSFEVRTSVSEILNLPLSIYFLNKESHIESANQTVIDLCAFESLKEGVGKSVFDIFKNEASRSLIKNDTHIIKHNKICVFDEEMIVKNDIIQAGLSIKFPLYDYKNTLIGIFGCSILNGLHSLPESLLMLMQTGFISKINEIPIVFKGAKNEDIYLTKREIAILKLLTKGFSAREMSANLFISERTVEAHIRNIKLKLGVNSRSEIIEKFLSRDDMV